MVHTVPLVTGPFTLTGKLVSKVSQINKWSWYQAIDLPNYVVHVYQTLYETKRIVGLNFGGHAILPFTMGITMGKDPKNKISQKKYFLMEFWQI